MASAEAAYAKQMEAEREAEKEKRIAHLQQSAARQKRMLAAAGARLARPALAAAVAHWVGDWRAIELARQALAAGRTEKALADSVGSERAMLLAELSGMHVRLAA